MNIYVAHSSNFDFKNELYKPIQQSALNNEHHIVLPHEFSDIPANTKDLIKSYDLLIAEISFPSTGEGIEIGWADVFNVPMLGIFKTGQEPSSSAKVVIKDIIEYDSPEDMVVKLSAFINNFSIPKQS